MSQELGKGSIITGKVRRNSIDETLNKQQCLYNSQRMSPTQSSWYIINKDNSLMTNAQSSSIFKSKVTLIIYPIQEKGYRLDFKNCHGGKFDKQGWNEITSGIHIGDPYMERSSSPDRIRLHIKEVSSKTFIPHVNPRRNIQQYSSVYASDCSQVINSIN